ncbi:Sec7 domain, alpha orthogonal bundle [Lasallia pustulata]|uniref:Sec7 domain, alpha orthogonal bundle n=1 Tax=Lasallia pustulata TaxID=136370 RepID=A0A1W5D0B4_9LECA|nr:Sec7 domain, alpha orthogonal bundle [Lasallia pustulata]
MVNSHSEPLLYDDYEAAPTPIVPVGLRGDSSSSSALYPPQPPPASSRAPLPRLQNDAEPLRSRSAGSAVPESDDTRDTEGKRQDHESMRTTLQELPALPAFFDPPILGTAVSTEKPFAPSIQSAAPSMRDRPGFFRRVFGSSRSHPGTLSDSRRPSSPFAEPLPLQTGLGADSRNAQGPQIPPQSNLKRQQVRGVISIPPTKDPTKDTSQAHLNKKPSSFFRRRKKSSADQHPFPTFPSQLPFAANDNVLDQPTDPSPVSSLRKVMNPYLHDNLVPHSDGTHDEGVRDYDAAFLAGYTARNEASVKLFKEASAGRNITSPLRKSPDASATRFPKLDFNPPTHHDDSFLQDSSSNEGKSLPRTSHLQLDLAKESTRKSKNNQETPKSAERQPPPEGKGKTLMASPIAADRAKPREVNAGVTAKHPAPPSPIVAKLKQPAKGPPNGAEPKEWITTAHLTSGRNKLSSRIPPSKPDRVWLEPTSSDEDVYMSTNLSLPLEGPPNSIGASESSFSDYKSASSRLPTSPFKPSLEVPALLIEADHVEVKTGTDATEPTEQDRQQAKKLYDGDEDGVAKDKAAAWLGESGAGHARVLRAYMEFFEWRNLNILASLRDLCGRLLLKGETQQVDRILDAFSIRWVSCNANHGFKATDVVHTICYSILLLNTDLHLAEIEQKMTRTQFIRNTMPTIRRVASEAAPNEFDTLRAAPSNEMPDAYLHPSTPKSPTLPVELQEGRPSNEDNFDIEALSNQPLTHLDYDTPLDDCGPLVKAPFHGKLTTWEVQVEIVLKDFYNSIRQQRLPLYGSDVAERGPEAAPSMTSLSVIASNMLRRTPSVLSKTGSEHFRSRGRARENRPATGRWAVKPRSRPRLYPASTLGSSRTSLDDDSIWSPSISSSWSKYSFGKTQTSMSVDSLGSSLQQGDYQQSIGFANALSQAIIREEAAGGSVAEDNVRVAPLLEDESLGLVGAPWAKEGILKHKHLLESVDKKAKDRNWTECFAVIEQGWMRLFSFHMNAKSTRQKAKNQKASGGVVGGGNWTESAEALGKFLLRQTIASALPPPGYSKTRPHVWALSLPNGAVHLFQVGTPEIVKEFVTTANYWSARLSKEPFVGGISNVEYGWGNSIINAALLQNENRPPSGANIGGPRLSLQSSIRSSLDQGSVRAKLPGDKIVINDWLPPQQSMAASALLEVDQLKGLSTYVKNVEEDLQKHNELRGAMSLAVSFILVLQHTHTQPLTPPPTLKQNYCPPWADLIIFHVSTVLAPPPQLRQGDGELGAQIGVSPSRDCEVSHLCRLFAGGAGGEGTYLCWES